LVFAHLPLVEATEPASFCPVRLTLPRALTCDALASWVLQAKVLCGKGGDWERKNKLKVGCMAGLSCLALG